MSRVHRLLWLLVAAGIAGCSTAPQRPLPPTLEDIVALERAGLPDDQVIARVAESRGRYYLRAESVDFLLKNGVSRPVVDFLLGTAWAPSVVYYRHTCQEPWYWHTGYWHHHGHHWR